MATKQYNRIMLGKGGKYAKICRHIHNGTDPNVLCHNGQTPVSSTTVNTK